MRVGQALSYPSPQAPGGALPSPSPGPGPDLASEHALLLRQVAARAEALLAVAAAGRRPAAELEALVGYLRAEILRQAADEEILLFPAHGAPAGLARLAAGHARLRAGIEILERAAGDAGASPAMIASATREFLCRLEGHLAEEEAVLAAPGEPGGVPATTLLGRPSHEWYPLTEGRVIELDALPPDQAVEAVARRLMRLRRDERVEIRSGRDPVPVWQRIDELAPGRYSFVYLEDGPDRWRVRVTRRAQR
jgi:uncharacterized protein (DUF2249 family)